MDCVQVSACGSKSGLSIPEFQGRALLAVWESGDVGNLDQIMTDASRYEAVQQAHVYDGIDAVKIYVGHARLFASHLRVEVLSVSSSETTAALEWKMTGIQSQPIEGRIPVATNRKFDVRGVTLVEIEGDLIHKATDYMDILGFVVQLGAKVELPGGVVVEED